MALEKVEYRIKQPAEKYAALKAKILASVNPATEKVVDGMIYCKRCYQPKMYDEPQRPFVVKCCCDCEVEAWHRSASANKRWTWLKGGDYNPFDK